jgi:hypothetical protein
MEVRCGNGMLCVCVYITVIGRFMNLFSKSWIMNV